MIGVFQVQTGQLSFLMEMEIFYTDYKNIMGKSSISMKLRKFVLWSKILWKKLYYFGGIEGMVVNGSRLVGGVQYTFDENGEGKVVVQSNNCFLL